MAATRIQVMSNGSLRVEGDFEIVDSEGRPFGLAGRQRVSLCRCGHSGTKPYCDGTHRRVDFVSRPLFEPEPIAAASDDES